MIAEITPINPSTGLPDNSLPWNPSGGRPDNSLPGGGRPSNPIVIPPLPGIWPKPGIPNFPVDPGYGLPDYAPVRPSNPIVITEGPENPIALPPGVYPPLPPPGSSGKYAVLILVVGVGYRWVVVDPSTVAQPK